MSRAAVISIEFEALLAKARADYQAFRKEAEEPIRVSFSGDARGQSTVSTIGGLSANGVPSSATSSPVPSSANTAAFGGAVPSFEASAAQVRGAMQGLARAYAVQTAAVARQTSEMQAAAEGTETGGASPTSATTPRRPRGRGVLGLFGATGPQVISGVFAVHGLQRLERAYLRNRELAETLEYEGAEEASKVAARQTREDRNELGYSGIRSAFVHTSRFFGLDFGQQTDDERLAQDRRSAATIKADQSAEKIAAAIKSTNRRTALVGLDPIQQRRAELGYELEDVNLSIGATRREANIDPSLDPGRRATLRREADEAAKSAKAFYDAQTKLLNQSRYDQIRNIGREDEIVSARGANQPIRAGRLELERDIENHLAPLRRLTNSPTLKHEEILAADRIATYDAQAKRQTDLATLSLRGENEAGEIRLGRHPLQSRLRSFVGGVETRYRALSADSENNAEREQLRRELATGQEQIQQDDRDERELQNIRLDTRERQVKFLLGRNPYGAEAAGIAGGALARSEELKNQDKRDFARRELELGRDQLGVQRQHYLDQFRGEAVDLRHFDVSNPRDANVEGKMLEAINSQTERLETAIKDLVSD